MDRAWKEYQEEEASLFRSIGAYAATDVTLKGVRTHHDVDVVVTLHQAGFDVTWLVECKHWKTPVSKLHVLALREIVAEVGADRGILLCEAGFQSGAIEAAKLTNVQVTSLRQMRATAIADIYAMRLRELYDRLESGKERYWDIPKEHRITHGLRQDIGAWGYSGARTLELCNDLLSRALRGLYPLKSDTLAGYTAPGLPAEFVSPEEVVNVVEPLIRELETKLDAYDANRDNA